MTAPDQKSTPDTQGNKALATTWVNRVSDVIWALLLVHLMVMAIMFFAQRHLQYKFHTDPIGHPEKPGWALVSFDTNDGLTLNSWYAPPLYKNVPVVAFFHGNAGDVSGRIDKVQRFQDQGYGVLLLEYRAAGGNPGQISEEGLYNDARAGLIWLLATQRIAPENIILYGESLGTGVAVQMALEYPAGALILEAPFSSATSVAQSRYPFLPVRLLLKDQYNSYSKIEAVKMPFLIAHGTADRVIPFEEGKALYSLGKPGQGRFIRIDGAGHSDLYTYPQMETGVFDFLKKVGYPVER